MHYLFRTHLDLGGPVRATLDLCTALSEAGHEVTLVTTDDRDTPEDWPSAGSGGPLVVKLPGVPSPFRLGGGPCMRRCREQLARNDVLALHGMWRPDQVPVAAAARKLGCPCVFSTHGTIDEWSMMRHRPRKLLFLAMFGKRMLRGADVVHCTAESELAQARKWFPNGHGAVVPPFRDLEPFRAAAAADGNAWERKRAPDEPPRVLFLSRLHPGKGIEFLIEAVRDLRDASVACELLIAGSGEQRYCASLKQLASELDVNDRVRFVGFVGGPDKIALYRSADVFCLPSIHENFGQVWAEAFAAGTPVATTKGVGLWKELEACGGALIVERCTAGFREAIRALVGDPARAQEMGRRGHDWVFDFLDRDRVIEQFRQMYADAISRHRARRG